MSRSTTLVLVRHAESKANRDGILGGHVGCTGLTDVGCLQAAALRDRFVDSGLLPGVTVLASRLARAVQTAEILLGDSRTPEQRCDLCDVHWGDLDGAPAATLDTSAGVYEPVAPGGESWFAFERRSRRALLTLAWEFAGQTVVIVTHGGIVKSSLYTFGGQNSLAAAAVSYTGVTTWSDEGAGWRLVGYDNHNHLATGMC